MTETQVRIYQPQDLERILSLAKELDTELARRSRKERNSDDSVQWYKKHYLKPGTKYQVLVALYQEMLDGYIVGSPTFGIPEADCSDNVNPFNTTASEVSIVFVTASSRGNGIGKVLVNSLMDHVKSQFHHKEIEAYVANWNEPSLAIFRALGFKEQKSETRSYFTYRL